MPQLKIKDVKGQVEEIEQRFDEKLADLIEDVKKILQEANINVSTNDKNELVPFEDKIETVSAKVDKLRSEMLEHVKTYNNHIMQQHGQRGKR